MSITKPHCQMDVKVTWTAPKAIDVFICVIDMALVNNEALSPILRICIHLCNLSVFYSMYIYVTVNVRRLEGMQIRVLVQSQISIYNFWHFICFLVHFKITVNVLTVMVMKFSSNILNSISLASFGGNIALSSTCKIKNYSI